MKEITSYLRHILGMLMILTMTLVEAQQVQVSGTIIDDETKEPLIGVSIQVKGTVEGTITDVNGNFSLSVNSENVLVISYLGFKSVEILVGSQTTIDVSLKPDIQALDEVVVIGYGEIKKSDLTGAVSRIGSEDIEQANANDVITSLQGRATGVQITQASGAPGSGVNVQVRGINSINAGTAPLYVIDGIQINQDTDLSINPLLDLNPADIKSMEILKDASATSIYGARGANGVVMITTKKGRSGKGKIDLNVQTGVTYLVNNVDMMTNEEYLAYQDEFVRKRAIDQGFASSAFQANVYGMALEAGLANHPDFEPWLDQFSSLGSNTEFNLSASGGSKAGFYRISLGLNDQDGILDNSGLRRYTARVNLTRNVNDRLKVNFNVSGARVEIEGIDESGTNNGIYRRLLYTNPFLNLLNDPEYYLGEDVPIDEELYDVNDSLSRVRNSPANFFATERAEDNNNIYRGRLELTYKLSDEFKFSIAGNYNLNNRTRINSASPESRTAFDTNGEVWIREIKNTTWTAETKLSFDKDINNDHRISAIAVGELQRTRRDYLDIRNQGFGDFISGANNFGSGTIFVSEPFQTTISSLASVLARVNYTWKDKYLFTASTRLDASSKFPNNRSALFSALAVGWNVHEESFMEQFNVVSNFKLRSSIGQTGNQSIPAGASQTNFTRSLIVIGDGVNNDQPVTVWIPNQLGNDDLEWEKHTTFDVGAEIGLYQNRVNIEMGYFNKRVSDVVFERPITSENGYSWAWDNIGRIQSIGWEHAVEAIVLETNDLTLTVNANASIIKSYIREITNESDFLYGSRSEDWQYVFAVDGLIGDWTGYILDGVYSTPEELANAVLSTQRVEYGLFKFTDVNLDGVADDNDIAVLGNSLPLVTGGFGVDVKWKNFDFHTFFQYSNGADIVNTNITGNFTGTNGGTNTMLSIIDSNYSEGSPLAESSAHFSANSVNANRNIEDGSFIRWSNLSIGYSLPQKMLKRAKLRSARVAIQGNNLALFTKYSWFDPEVNSTSGASGTFLPGFDNTVYPRNRMWEFSFTLGL